MACETEPNSAWLNLMLFKDNNYLLLTENTAVKRHPIEKQLAASSFPKPRSRPTVPQQ
jgi:hypothetical protein